MSLLCVAQHANVQLACCSNLNLHTILRLRVDSSFETLTCTALGPNRRFSSEFAFWELWPKFENRCGVFLCPDNRVCLRGHVGTTRRAQRRRISSFPFVGPQDQTVNARDRRRRALLRRNNESISPSPTFYGFAQRADHRALPSISRTHPSPLHSNL